MFWRIWFRWGTRIKFLIIVFHKRFNAAGATTPFATGVRLAYFASCQDVRAGRLLIRFKGGDCKLKAFSGVIGQVLLTRNFSLCSDGLKAGALQVVNTYCMRRACPPTTRTRTIVDTPLAKRFRSLVEVWNTDAAADEHLAGAKMKDDPNLMTSRWDSQLALGKKEDGMPNIILCTVDTTHAARRIQHARSIRATRLMSIYTCVWRG